MQKDGELKLYYIGIFVIFATLFLFFVRGLNYDGSAGANQICGKIVTENSALSYNALCNGGGRGRRSAL